MHMQITAPDVIKVAGKKFHLPSNNPESWYNSDLRKLISEYVNPNRKHEPS